MKIEPKQGKEKKSRNQNKKKKTEPKNKKTKPEKKQENKTKKTRRQNRKKQENRTHTPRYETLFRKERMINIYMLLTSHAQVTPIYSIPRLGSASSATGGSRGKEREGIMME